MEKIEVKMKKLDKRAILPSYGSPFAAGADLYACIDRDITIAPGKTEFIKTGLAMELPKGLVALVYARRGLASKRGLAPANKVGVVDCDYRGELMVALHNHSDKEETVQSGDRIAQMVITPYITADFKEADVLSDTVRGEGGFGSTGRK